MVSHNSPTAVVRCTTLRRTKHGGDVIGEGASDVWFVFNEANLEKAGEVVDVPEEEN